MSLCTTCHPGALPTQLTNQKIGRISFFAHPTLAESSSISAFVQLVEKPPPRRNPPLQFLIAASGEQAWNRALSNARTKLYVDIVRAATEIYLLRARFGNTIHGSELPTSSAVLETDPALPGEVEELAAELHHTDIFAPRIAHMRQLLEQVEPSAPGSHTIVWPAFVAAAESRTPEDRDFFSAVLRRIWASTGYLNVLRGLDALPEIWEGQTRGERWTAALPGLKTVVM